ncbi:MAG: DUF1540 domain-containing protein [Clostridia bacterium]|nr:DUF1540 domain-containing protein [Clostridia bacterium]MBQ3849953.1 DUF1540 domain-containing protein [Clostridia bacterium]MBR3459394.1 DUF1540 domain-containing protein [Clostridia bacterium]MBR5713610.1 DUF1540 domain-containing protein [Clostridia bacterium]MBR5719370.1 DUF1540 domain-containing protein [Clostridia bacterium]
MNNNVHERVGNQAIGCGVTSCRYNAEGSVCELHRVEIKPCYGCGNTGKPEDESCCGSYSHR